MSQTKPIDDYIEVLKDAYQPGWQAVYDRTPRSVSWDTVTESEAQSIANHLEGRRIAKEHNAGRLHREIFQLREELAATRRALESARQDPRGFTVWEKGIRDRNIELQEKYDRQLIEIDCHRSEIRALGERLKDAGTSYEQACEKIRQLEYDWGNLTVANKNLREINESQARLIGSNQLPLSDKCREYSTFLAQLEHQIAQYRKK